MSRQRLPSRHKFLVAWMRAPRRVGSIMPSSRFLSRLIAAQVDPHRPGVVVELGGGTGTVTRGLLERGVKPDRLLVIERDRRLHAHLQQHFPQARVLRADAVTLKTLLEQEKVHKVSAVVCCLPLLTLPDETVDIVLEQIFSVLDGDGVMVQYTYGPLSPVGLRLLKRLHLKARRAGKVWLNVPPATVWCYSRK